MQFEHKEIPIKIATPVEQCEYSLMDVANLHKTLLNEERTAYQKIQQTQQQLVFLSRQAVDEGVLQCVELGTCASEQRLLSESHAADQRATCTQSERTIEHGRTDENPVTSGRPRN